jgi:hypothetical protein
MKNQIITVLLSVMFFLTGIQIALPQTPEEQYQKALIKEEGEGNLPDAIKIFAKVAANSTAGEALQAKALLHWAFATKNWESRKPQKHISNWSITFLRRKMKWRLRESGFQS